MRSDTPRFPHQSKFGNHFLLGSRGFSFQSRYSCPSKIQGMPPGKSRGSGTSQCRNINFHRKRWTHTDISTVQSSTRNPPRISGASKSTYSTQRWSNILWGIRSDLFGNPRTWYPSKIRVGNLGVFSDSHRCCCQRNSHPSMVIEGPQHTCRCNFPCHKLNS